MRKPSACFIILFCTTSLLSSCGQAKVTMLSTAPLRQVPDDYDEYTDSLLSPDGRYLLIEFSGGMSGQNCFDGWDLTRKDKKPAIDLSFARDASFTADGSGLLYWQYDNVGASGLYFVPLRRGKARRVYPLTDKAEDAGSFSGYGTTWNSRTGEVLCSRAVGEQKGEICAIRLKDSRLCRIVPFGGAPVLSADGSRIAFMESSFIYVADITGKNCRRLLPSAELIDWLPDGEDLLVVRGGVRGGGSGEESTKALFRYKVRTGSLSYLAEVNGSAFFKMSPSRQWLAVWTEDSLSLLHTAHGQIHNVPIKGVATFCWGRNDTELFYRQKKVWSRAVLRIEHSSKPARPQPKPETMHLSLPDERPLRWKELTPASGPWKTYHTTADIKCLAFMQDEIWLGTSGGLRVVDSSGKDTPLAPWQKLLMGHIVDRIVPDGDTVWIAARQFFRGYFSNVLLRVRPAKGEIVTAASLLDEWSGSYPTDIAVTRGRGVMRVGDWVSLAWGDTRGTARLPTPESRFSNSIVRSLAVSDDGSTWWAGWGVTRWRMGEETATNWNAKHGLASDAVQSLLEDAGRFWVGTDGGVSLLDPATGGIQMFFGRSVLGGLSILQIVPTRTALYFRTPAELIEHQRERKNWNRWPLPSARPADLYSDNDSLFGDFGEKSPLMKFDGKGGWRAFALPRSGEILSNNINSLVWHGGALWCSSPRGVSRLDVETGKFISFPLPKGCHLLQHLASDGRYLWCALQDRGILQLDPRTGKQKQWLRTTEPDKERPREKPSALPFTNIFTAQRYVYGLSYDEMWRLDKQTGKSQQHYFGEHWFGLGGDYRAVKILHADESDLWVIPDGQLHGSTGGKRGEKPKETESKSEDEMKEPEQETGVAHLGEEDEESAAAEESADGKEGEAQETNYTIPAPAPLMRVRLPEMTVAMFKNPLGLENPLVFDPGKGLWTVREAELQLVSIEGEVLKRFPLPQEGHGRQLQDLIQTDDALWMATDDWRRPDAIIYRFSLDTGKWKSFPCPLAAVRKLLVAGGNLWVATNNGLAQLPLNPNEMSR